MVTRPMYLELAALLVPRAPTDPSGASLSR
jgi:hypothetical protein